MKGRLKAVIDTNVLLVCISSKSKYHWLYKKILNAEFDLFVTHEILIEYEEVISSKYNTNVAKSVIRTFLLLPNVHPTNIYFKWHLIEDDADDNKFVDCAISNSHVIVTHDKHFGILKGIEFPMLTVVNLQKFDNLFEQFAQNS